MSCIRRSFISPLSDLTRKSKLITGALGERNDLGFCPYDRTGSRRTGIGPSAHSTLGPPGLSRSRTGTSSPFRRVPPSGSDDPMVADSRPSIVT